MKFERPYELVELANLVNAEILGDSTLLVGGVSDVFCATHGDITFAEDAKHLEEACASLACAIIVSQNLNLENSNISGKTLLKTTHAQDAINTIASSVFCTAPPPINTGTHQSAEIDPSATILDLCIVGPNCVIGKNAFVGRGSHIQANVVIQDDCIIGEACIIGPNTVVYNGCKIGNRVVVQSGCHIGNDPFYYYDAEGQFRNRVALGSVHIAEDVVIGSGCTISRGVCGDTTIGAGSKLDSQVHVAHDVYIGSRVLIAAHTGVAGYATISDKAVIRGHVGVMPQVRIGVGAEVLAKSGVSKDVGDGQVVFGIPARTRDHYIDERRFLKKRVRRLEQDMELHPVSQRRIQLTVVDRVLQAVAIVSSVDRSAVELNKRLTEDLEFDSLDVAELQTVLEEEFEFATPVDDAEFEKVRLVSDVVNLCYKYRAK